jgi:hypothetical protein
VDDGVVQEVLSSFDTSAARHKVYFDRAGPLPSRLPDPYHAA